jgi:hypothetical protein
MRNVKKQKLLGNYKSNTFSFQQFTKVKILKCNTQLGLWH